MKPRSERKEIWIFPVTLLLYLERGSLLSRRFKRATCPAVFTSLNKETDVKATETRVKAYKNAKDYLHDVQKMSKQGWSVVAAVVVVKKHLLTRPKPQLVVIYRRAKR